MGMRAKTTSPVDLPSGFDYQPEFLSSEEEIGLVEIIQTLPFQAVKFQGYVAKRRIVSYGFNYDFGSRQTTATEAIPAFLDGVRERAALWAGLQPADLQESIVSEYSPGTPIGWHRDAPQFEVIVGISLAATCRMRLKPYSKEGKPLSVNLEPRSIYALRGLVRWQYQHSIPPVAALRYSITFRTLREKGR